MSTTLRLARAGGAGTVLRTSTDRWQVSDWSVGTGAVFGRRWIDGRWADYGRMPPRTRHETEAERLEAESGALSRFGDSPDPAERDRRRMRGMDGLRDDVHDVSAPLRERLRAIGAEAAEIAARMVRERLRELEDRFPRHRFTAVSSGLDPMSLHVHPPIRGISTHPVTRIGGHVCAEGWLGLPLLPRQDVAAFIHGIEREIAYVMVTLSDEFRTDVGVVTTSDGQVEEEAVDDVSAG